MTHRRPYLPAGMRETALSSKCSLPQSSFLLALARLRLSWPSKRFVPRRLHASLPSCLWPPKRSARRRQSVHFANGNPAKSMKTNHRKNSNRYTFPRIKDSFPLRPPRRRAPETPCLLIKNGEGKSNRNNCIFKSGPNPMKIGQKTFSNRNKNTRCSLPRFRRHLATPGSAMERIDSIDFRARLGDNSRPERGLGPRRRNR
jgi:hypothetical protein